MSLISENSAIIATDADSFTSRPQSLTPQQKAMELLYEQYQHVARGEIAEGRAGRLVLSPKSIWLNISDNCNLRCVGCYSEGKFKKNYVDIEEVRKSIQFEGNIEEISFTTNEAMLHPQFCDIIDMCRELHPSARLWVITNGTIPLKGRYRNAISKLDKVGLSIDGATKETFEGIRIGARFEDFIENAKAIVNIKKETGFPKAITFSFTATSSNLHELIDVVRLAHTLGVSDIWAQAMEAKEATVAARISTILIDNLDPEHRAKLIDDARAEAAQLGIGFYFSQGIYPSANVKNGETAEREQQACDTVEDMSIRLCRYPWDQPLQVSKHEGNYVVRPCCYISTTKVKLLADKYRLTYPEILSGEKMYNSAQLWQFREDLMLGKTADLCSNCDAARGFQWKPPSS